jgi:hypothetical protein
MRNPDLVIEMFSFIGAPARVFGRLLFITRYLWNGFSPSEVDGDYVRQRFGELGRWRLWLQFDLLELEEIEALINTGSDQKVLAFRRHQLEAMQMVAIVVCQLSDVA